MSDPVHKETTPRPMEMRSQSCIVEQWCGGEWEPVAVCMTPELAATYVREHCTYRWLS